MNPLSTTGNETTMKTRFKTPDLQKLYAFYVDKPPVYRSGPYKGQRHSGSSGRSSFWLGYDGIKPHWLGHRTQGGAAWAAGQDVAKQGRTLPGPPVKRTI